MSERNNSLYIVKLAERAKRYDDVVRIMKNIIQDDARLSFEEQKIFYNACQNLSVAKRYSIRTFRAMEEEPDNAENIAVIQKYRIQIQKELFEKCGDILNLLDHYLIPSSSTRVSQVHYYKMKGDYHRYTAEVLTGEERDEAADNALAAYTTGDLIAKKYLAPINDTRLSLVVNFGAFYFDIMNAIGLACSITKAAINNAMAYLDVKPNEKSLDSMVMLELLKNNLSLWSKKPKPASANSAQEGTSSDAN